MAMAAMLLPLASCINDNYADEPAATSGTISVGLSIQTRAITNSGDEGEYYVAGSEWENYIDIASGDFRIYFFTYDPSEQTTGGTNSTLIAEFTPTDIELVNDENSNYTTYTMSGEVDERLIGSLDNFKVVVIANWGVNNYPSVTAGTTTIDDICNAGTFSAFVSSGTATMPSSSRLIPFFGVREYSGVTWTVGRRTNLDGAITLLRAVAKVEVIVNADSDVDSFDNVSIVNYNATGYCAPQNVYLRSDYDSGYTDWARDFVDGLHLVGDANDTASKTMVMQKTAATTTTQETWTCYLPEYANTYTNGSTTTAANDYSHISLTIDGEQYEIYFANYNEGVTTTTADYDIYRNYLYRFHVTLKDKELRVEVETWENVFDNEWSFGELAHLIYADDDINYFTADDGYIYASLVELGEEENPTVYLQKVSQTTTGYVRIPETVTYMGYTYTVVGIGSYCFDADTGITFIDIPESITYIESEAFHGDTGLEGIAVHSETPPTCAEDAFEGDSVDTIILYVPTNAVAAYEKTSPWSSFTNIIGIDFVQ